MCKVTAQFATSHDHNRIYCSLRQEVFLPVRRCKEDWQEVENQDSWNSLGALFISPLGTVWWSAGGLPLRTSHSEESKPSNKSWSPWLVTWGYSKPWGETNFGGTQECPMLSALKQDSTGGGSVTPACSIHLWTCLSQQGPRPGTVAVLSMAQPSHQLSWIAVWDFGDPLTGI